MVSVLGVVVVPLFKTRQTNSDLIQYKSLRAHHRHSCACWTRINSVPVHIRLDELPVHLLPFASRNYTTRYLRRRSAFREVEDKEYSMKLKSENVV